MRNRIARWMVRLAPLMLLLLGPCGQGSSGTGY